VLWPEDLKLSEKHQNELRGDLKFKYPHLKWKDMGNMRNRLIHDYFGTDYEIVYDTAYKDIPDLFHEMKRIMEIEGRK